MQEKQQVLNDMMSKMKMREFIDEVKKSPELFDALVARLKTDPNLLQRISVRTDFLDSDFCSFHEHLENLRLSFPEYQWDQSSKNFQVVRIISAMLNFQEKKRKESCKKTMPKKVVPKKDEEKKG